MKISPNIYGRMDGFKILMFSLVSRKFLAMRNIVLYSVPAMFWTIIVLQY